MRYASITKIFHFEAAHSLPGHRGKCERLHGHSYTLEVTLRGPIRETHGSSDEGMVMDFADLSALVTMAVIERLDHQELNSVTGIRTTAENLVHWIWDELIAHGLPDELLQRIRLWETRSGFAEVTRLER
ncbi:MAG TPA: 6-carboxytetrahydropterin synthase QueD [Ktedonobacter sp.]|nr:6-carboxytetrahydropterin synthase QueD [Ktedonobacter sp.]